MKCLVAAAVLAVTATVHASPRIEYRIDLTDEAQRQKHLVSVEMVVRNAPSPLPLAMPIWTLGAYELRTWGKNVSLVGARSTDDKELSLRRTGPSTFVVEGHAAGAEVRVRYRVYAALLSDDGSHLDARHAYINGTSVLLFSPPLSSQPCAFSVAAPATWKVASALPVSSALYEAKNYEALVDGPIEVGRHAEATLETHGRTVQIVVDGPVTTVPPRLLADVTAILDAEIDLVGLPPWTRYLLLIHLDDGIERMGALEHPASSSVLMPRRALEGEPWKGDSDAVDSYDDLLYVVAHELFHAWNGRLLRPAELMPWDPLQPRPARSLWITEGVTEFFAHRAMLLSRRWTTQRWREQVCEEVVRASLAARRGLSIEEDAELAWSSPSLATADPDGYYARGHMAALTVDVALAQTGGLAAVWRRLVAEATRQGHPLAIDTERLAAALGDEPAAALLRRLAAGHDEVGRARDALAPHGLVLKVEERPPVAFLGLTLELSPATSTEPAGLRVLHVIPGSAAELAGLDAADRIVAVDGAPVTRGTVATLESMPANRPIAIQLRRENRSLRIQLTPESLIIPRCALDETPTQKPYLPR